MTRIATVPTLIAAIASALVLTLAAQPAQAQSVQVKDFDVYVDLPTRFAFIKTPMGWKFIRRLDEQQMAQLHPRTLTALLPREQEEIHWAHPALELSPRALAQRGATTLAAAR